MLIRQLLISLSKVTINMYHLWATIDFDNTRIINDDALRCHFPGLRSIIQTLIDLTTAEYVRAPLAPGSTRINILLTNLKHNTIDPSSINFEDTVMYWYSDLLLSTDTLPQILPALRTESFKHLTSPIPHNTLHKYICPCSMFTPVLCFTPFHRPSTKLT